MQTVIFVTTVFEDVESGPGVYSKYLWEELKDSSDFNFFLLAPDVRRDDARIISFSGSEDAGTFYENMEQRLVEFMGSRPNDQFITHLNIPHSLSRLPSTGKSVVQANDYDAALLSLNVLDALKNNTLKRVLRLFWRRFREERIFNQADLVLANSQFTADVLKSEYKLSTDDVRVVYKAVDIGLFTRPENPPDAFGSDTLKGKAKFRLLFVGSNWQRKGLDILFQSVQLLLTSGKDVEVVVVGPEAFGASSEIKKHIMQSQWASHFHFVGRIGRKNVPAQYWAADLLVLPSRAEALGVAVIESLAAGLPVVATRVGGIPEIVEGHDVGLLVPIEDSEALAKAVATLIENPERLSSMAKNAVARAEDFSKLKMLDELKKVYCELFQ